MEPFVTVTDLTKKFNRFTAVDHLNFSVERGEIFGFLGPNGAGKSTTIKMLCGILTSTSGNGTVLGYDINHEQDKIKESIGYMSQRFSLYDDLTIVENLTFFGNIYGLEGKKLSSSIAATLKILDISSKDKFLVKSLPAGIKQRLALATAVLHDPKILFLDEPTSGVDPQARRNFWDLIYTFAAKGKTIFVTTHYMDEAEHCDRIALIIGGKMIALDTPEVLKKSLPYKVYNLRCDQFSEAFNYLKNQKWTEDIAFFGSDIHLMIKDSNIKEQQIKSALTKGGFKKYELEPILPSLEDVFVTYARSINIS